MRKLQLALFALLIIVSGCKKEEIVTITKSSGKVIERSTNVPMSGIKVAVSNGQRELVTATTDTEGRFEFIVDFDKVTASDSLLLDGRPNLPFKKYELKGMGKAEYDYGTLWLYDKSDDMYLPQVTTDSIISVDTTSAALACAVKSDGGFTVTKRGVCYATRQLPDFSDNVKVSGSGTGAYICEIGNLMPATDYYYRAFAINAIDTVYGEQKSFRTLAKTYSVYVSASPSNGGEVTGGGVFEEGSTQTVVATANTGSTFINWTENGNEVSTDARYSFTVNGNRTLVAHFQVKTYTVTTSSNPANGGSTTGGGIFNHGQGCTLRATPAEDYTFLRWTKNGTQVSTEPNYTFDVTESGNYVAHFTNQPLTFTVSVSANLSNGGTVTGGGTYGMGQTCTVRATANSGYVFANWTENGTVVSEQANYTFPVAGNRTLKANFTISQNAYTINVSANPTNGGTVAGGGSFNQGQSCTVTATPDTGFVFVKWTENGNKVSEDLSYTFIVSGNRTLVAQFQMVTYTVSTSSNPSNGGVTSGGGTYQQGQQCTVTATANAGFSFVNWTENGNVVSSNASYTFAVNSNRSLVANFASQTYTISVSANPSNGGGVSGGGTYSYGQSCTVTATAAAGFNFANWTENGNAVSSSASYTFTVTGNRTLVANFLSYHVSTEPSNRNVILEEFTGRACGYCPDGHRIANQLMTVYPDRFWAINIHAGGYAPTSYPNMITQDGNIIHSGFSISGYPTGVVNRSTASGQDREQWGSIISQQLNQTSECNVAGVVVLNPQTRIVSITVEVYYTGNSSVGQNYLTVAMLQDSILGSQADYGNYNPTQWLNGQYVHMHILRDVINESAWGDPISPTTQGTLITRTYEYQIPEIIGSPNGVEVDVDNIYFLAWVSECYQGASSRPVLNACKLLVVRL